MVNKDLIAAKLADLDDRVQRVRANRPARPEAFDRDSLDLVSFNLMLCVQTCADIASHIIADAEWPPAKNLAQSFTRLEEHGVISARTAAALAHAVGLRNVVAHGYAGVDPTKIFAAAHAGVSDLAAYAQEVATWVGSSHG